VNGVGLVVLAAGLLTSTVPRHQASTQRPLRRTARNRAAGNPAILPSIAAIAGGLVVWTYGGPLRLTAPLIAVLAALALRRLRTQPLNAVTVAGPRSLALTLDLIGSALSAGLPPETAIATVADCIDAVPGTSLASAIEPLRQVGRLIYWGAEPAEAWNHAERHPGYEAVAAAGRRCADSGARLATALGAAAIELRAQRHEATTARAGRVGVWSLLPLGLCFLPAFICLGVLPVIVGLGGRLLSAPN
jgi:pilus assembly protein TadC